MAKYYKISSFPQLVIDGTQKTTPNNILKSDISIDENADVSIELISILNENELNLIAKVNVENNNPEFNQIDSDVRIFALVKEKEINYSKAPGSNGEKDFFDIIRYMFGKNEGEKISLDQVGSSTQLDFKQIIDLEIINKERLEVVVFVQNYKTGKIYQAQFQTPQIGASINESNETNFEIFPNPSSDKLYVKTNETNKLQILDLNGNVVLDAFSNQFINTSFIQNGIYFVKIENEVKKLIIN